MLGPLAFVGAWAGLGAIAGRYDPTRDAISKLAALGTPTRPAMTAGLLALGAGMALYGLALRPGPERPWERGASPGWPLPIVNGATAFAVALLPLGGGHDGAHGAAAAVGYVSLAAIPVVVGRRRPMGVVIGAGAGACLLASALVDRSGLLQRLGLTVAQAWVVVSAVGLLRRRRSSDEPATSAGWRSRT